MLAVRNDAWTQVVVALSIFVPVIVAAALTIWVLRGKKDDPDEQRWRRLEAERRAATVSSQRRE
jgi:heme/copper-type cytochrome/quinol oxidase subunit 2